MLHIVLLRDIITKGMLSGFHLPQILDSAKHKPPMLAQAGKGG